MDCAIKSHSRGDGRKGSPGYPYSTLSGTAASWNWHAPNIVDAARGRSLDPDRRYLPDPRRIRSRLNGPTGWVATYKNRKQYKAASSPPFKIGQNPRGACERK